MKAKKYVVLMAVFGFVLSACGEKSASSQSGETSTDIPAAEASSSVEEDQNEESEILNIRDTWVTRSLSVDAKGKSVGIEAFAKAFGKAYGKYMPNKVMYNNLTGNQKANEADELMRMFVVDNQAKNGYLKCELPTEYDWQTTCCYWKRNNGHSLVAFWLAESHEGKDYTDILLAFYDFDPATGTMKPEPKLAQKVDVAMKRYDAYSVNLPAEGKDIEVVGHKADLENDNYSNTDYLFRWNGYDFRMEEVE